MVNQVTMQAAAVSATAVYQNQAEAQNEAPGLQPAA